MMKITKFGHCCLLIKEETTRILTDPGNLSDGQNAVDGIDIILITHEHADHFHIESLKRVLHNNPSVKVITNTAVGKLLEPLGIRYRIVEHGEKISEQGVLIEGYGNEHAVFHSSLPNVQNTGYFVGNRLFYPGDALTNPDKPVDILALPAVGPWMKFSEGVEYAKLLQPKSCFPVHEAILRSPDFLIQRYGVTLASLGIRFIALGAGQTIEL